MRLCVWVTGDFRTPIGVAVQPSQRDPSRANTRKVNPRPSMLGDRPREISRHRDHVPPARAQRLDYFTCSVTLLREPKCRRHGSSTAPASGPPCPPRSGSGCCLRRSDGRSVSATSLTYLASALGPSRATHRSSWPPTWPMWSAVGGTGSCGLGSAPGMRCFGGPENRFEQSAVKDRPFHVLYAGCPAFSRPRPRSSARSRPAAHPFPTRSRRR